MTYRQVEKALCTGLLALACVALAAMTLWTVVDVGTRYFISKPLRGSIDFVESTLVLVVFLALPECFRRGDQITVDLFDHFAGPRTVQVLKVTGALGTIAFLAALLWTGWAPLADAWRFGDRKPDLPVPIFLLLGAIEFALAATIVVMLGRFIELFRGLFNRAWS